MNEQRSLKIEDGEWTSTLRLLSLNSYLICDLRPNERPNTTAPSNQKQIMSSVNLNTIHNVSVRSRTLTVVPQALFSRKANSADKEPATSFPPSK